MTRTLASEHAYDKVLSFDSEGDQATEAQIDYLKDLWTHLSYESTGGTPNTATIRAWQNLTGSQATHEIRRYLRALGRPDDRYYPEPGTPEFDALSPAGQEFAETAGQPAAVSDGFGW